MKYNKKILLGVSIILVVILVVLLISTKIKVEKQKEEEYNKLIADLCTTAIELAEKHPNVITINKEEVGSKFNVTLKTLALLTLGKENRVPAKIKNPKLSTEKKPVYFSSNMAMKLVVNRDKKVTCNEMIDLGEEPKITLKGEKTITLFLGEEYKEPGYTATDKEDGDLTSRVLKSGKPDVKVRGDYEIIYFVEDSVGNKTSETRKILVK